MVGCADGTVHLVNIAKGSVVVKKKMFEAPVETIKISPVLCREAMGDYMIAGADSIGSIKIWPLSTFLPRHELKHSTEESTVTCLQWSERVDNVVLLSGGNDGLVR